MSNFIAHRGQSLKDHLEGTARICRKNASKIGWGDYGEIIGLLHDLGKYSQEYQNYIKSAIGELNPDTDSNFVDSEKLKGKIDHSTAGAQFLWEKVSCDEGFNLLLQMFALCLASHHSGLMDCLTYDENGVSNTFQVRMDKPDQATHLHESTSQSEITARVNSLLEDPDVKAPMNKLLWKIAGQYDGSTSKFFQIGLLVRFLFSCLIDADRLDSANSDNPGLINQRQNGVYKSWSELAELLEVHLQKFGVPTTPVNVTRKEVSDACLAASEKEKGLFTLTVPTGGGKTLSSLRFALNHAKKHGMDRVFYVIPYTSIIDQNAEEVRAILEKDSSRGQVVLEHHSNIEAEVQTWKERLLIEDWDAPVVFTTMVQFLEAFYGSGTRGARRLHQLANSVIIFDEVQTVPYKCTHMFCNAVNFLNDHCGSTTVLCTATQPRLGSLKSKAGSLLRSSEELRIPPENEIIPDKQAVFDALHRVDIIPMVKGDGWILSDVADLVIDQMKDSGSCLAIVNTKRAAQALFDEMEIKHPPASVYHLSTAMCPTHRKQVLASIRKHLKLGEAVICVSTQLIEAGVDIDFGSVVRSLAGLDSIAQAAGRCNRHGYRKSGKVFVVNLQTADEDIRFLEDMQSGANFTRSILHSCHSKLDLIGPYNLSRYYMMYYRRPGKDYVLEDKSTLMKLLSDNPDVARKFKGKTQILKQSFRTASKAFRVVDSADQSIIVPFGPEGEAVIRELQTMDAENKVALFRKAQPFTVNLFAKQFERLVRTGCVHQIQPGIDIFYLDQGYYNPRFGVVVPEPLSEGF